MHGINMYGHYSFHLPDLPGGLRGKRVNDDEGGDVRGGLTYRPR